MTVADRRRLLHVLGAMERIDRYVGHDPAAMQDDKTSDAVLRCLTVIGEALGALTPETYVRLRTLPPHLPKAQRNLIVHEYWRVDTALIWETITRDLPPLRADIEAVLDEDGPREVSTV